MSDNANERTLESYNKHLLAYIAGTPQEVSGGVKDWIDAALAGLKPDARILELGSGFGRDAAYMQAQGFRVHCTDASEAFVAHLNENGMSASRLNVLTDPLAGPFDLIFANAVFLHFTRDDFHHALAKTVAALAPSGRVALSLKKGAGEAWSTEKLGAERFFCYWTRPDLEAALQGLGLTRTQISEDSSGHGSAAWLHVIASVN